jgi:hypothetical protein
VSTSGRDSTQLNSAQNVSMAAASVPPTRAIVAPGARMPRLCSRAETVAAKIAIGTEAANCRNAPNSTAS